MSKITDWAKVKVDAATIQTYLVGRILTCLLVVWVMGAFVFHIDGLMVTTFDLQHYIQHALEYLL